MRGLPSELLLGKAPLSPKPQTSNLPELSGKVPLKSETLNPPPSTLKPREFPGKAPTTFSLLLLRNPSIIERVVTLSCALGSPRFCFPLPPSHRPPPLPTLSSHTLNQTSGEKATATVPQIASIGGAPLFPTLSDLCPAPPPSISPRTLLLPNRLRHKSRKPGRLKMCPSRKVRRFQELRFKGLKEVS